MLAAAHAFQTFGGLAPCELCLKQRTVYWVAVRRRAPSAMVVVRLPGGPRWREATCWLLALVFLASVGVAGYHAGVEWKFWPGPRAVPAAARSPWPTLKALLNGGGVKMPRLRPAGLGVPGPLHGRLERAGLGGLRRRSASPPPCANGARHERQAHPAAPRPRRARPRGWPRSCGSTMPARWPPSPSTAASARCWARPRAMSGSPASWPRWRPRRPCTWPASTAC